LGKILVDSMGMTIYDFANDMGSTSTCTGLCEAAWPIVVAPAHLPMSLPGVTGKLGVTMRPDGGRQLTISGRPVYTFVGDAEPGDITGQNKVLNGGLWWAVSPAGKAITSSR
jgi:predicted lipoprotein with Yx(FWY)xxD motif